MMDDDRQRLENELRELKEKLISEEIDVAEYKQEKARIESMLNSLEEKEKENEGYIDIEEIEGEAEEPEHKHEIHHHKKHHVHHEHREKSNASVLWIAVAGLLAILLVVSIFTSGFKFNAVAGKTLTAQEAGNRAVNYINTNLLQGQATAALKNIKEKDGFYIANLEIAGQEYNSYITRDGKFLFPTVIDMSNASETSSGNGNSGGNAGLQRVQVTADDDPVLGSKDARVTIIEFSDFQCPFCERFWSQTLPQIKKEYIDTGKVKLVFRDFPLSFHENAFNSALAAECADEQGKYWEYHDKLFGNQQSLDKSSLKKYAKDLGLDSSKFDGCLDSEKYKDEVNKDQSDGSSAGVSGTPAFFINGIKLEGAQPFSAFKQVIDNELNGGSQPAAQQPTEANTAPPSSTVTADDDPVLGSKDARVTIIEFSDFQCPFCERFWSQTLPQIKKEYIDTGKVKLVFRDFPLSFHENAFNSALAAECADEQGKYWEYHDKLFGNQQSLDKSSLKKYAKDLGLDSSKFDGCLDSEKYKDEVNKDQSDGSSAGVSGTPSFFINGKLLVGAQPYSSFKTAIDDALAKAVAAGSSDSNVK